MKPFLSSEKVFLSGVGLLAALICLSLQQCSDKCQVKRTYTYYEPIYSTTDEIKASTGVVSPKPLSSPGKIYLKDQYLFVNETGKGIHIYDNTNRLSPQALSFLNIPGNFDLAISGNILYADSFVDLLLFDVSDISNIKSVYRIEGFFKNYSAIGIQMDAQQRLVTGWTEKSEVTVTENDCAPSNLQPWGGMYYRGGVLMFDNAVPQVNLSSTAKSTTGIGGSMARFTITDNYLYAIDGSVLAVADINIPTQPQRKADVTLLTWPETLFPKGQNLFVGSRAGMAIYDLSSPGQPALLSTYEHIYSCDPVVAQGDYAYVTLYNGDICHNNTNELQIIDIKDLKNPSLLTKYQMTNPHGLGLDENLLFICDGDAGLKIFDATDPNAIDSHLLASYPGVNAIDVIPYQNVALVIGKDGLYQYDYSNIKSMKLLSKIAIVTAP
ncbi:MAG TPA: hypothetical protein VL728_13315 [Cyclobacteriaceae bacterium]|jgi:hypothetical protein|nr:hypothetical protein [Cyclobacteriaceae bacterium]